MVWPHGLRVDPTTPRRQSLFRAIERMTPGRLTSSHVTALGSSARAFDARYLKLQSSVAKVTTQAARGKLEKGPWGTVVAGADIQQHRADAAEQNG
jgi:hypothetical protein